MADFHLADSLLTAIFNGIKSKILLAAYPVGSVYLSVNQTNPNTLFGGTWERMTDGFLFCSSGAGGTQGNLQGSAKSGGPSTNTSGATTLTVDQIPSHRHTSQNILRSGWWFYLVNSYCCL